MTTQTASRFFALLSLLTVTGVVGVGGLVALARTSAAPAVVRSLRRDVGRAALVLAWIVASVTTLGSLYYSEVAHFTPCKLCWIQRICIYPQSILLGVAVLRRDASVRWYSWPLCVIGAGFATYHTWLQANPDQTSSFCTLAAPCTDRYVWEFGFVSLPFMSLTAFIFVAVMLAIIPRPIGAAGDLPADDPEVTS